MFSSLPPKGRKGIDQMFKEAGLWRSGDASALQDHYPVSADYVSDIQRGLWRSTTIQRSGMRSHVPLANIVSNVMADLVFGRAPAVRIDGNSEGSEMFRDFLEDISFWASLGEGASVASTYGGVYIRTDWDSSVGGLDVSVVPPEFVYPKFVLKKLVEAIVWDPVDSLPGSPWESNHVRHVQHHFVDDRGPAIVHSLWAGEKTVDGGFGVPIDLNGSELTLGLQGEEVALSEYIAGVEGVGVRITVPGDRIMLEYVPNKRPSVFGVEGEPDLWSARSLMADLDMAQTSWARDIRTSLSTVLLDKDFLDRDKDGVPFLDSMREHIMLGKMKSSRGDATPAQQFSYDIRSDEHKKQFMTLFESIMQCAGLSPQTVGLHVEGQAPSGTALRIREKRSSETQARKRSYWRGPVVRTLENFMLLAGLVGVELPDDGVVSLEWLPTSDFDITEKGQFLANVAKSGSMSAEQRVRWLHPEWTEDQVQAELTALFGPAVDDEADDVTMDGDDA